MADMNEVLEMRVVMLYALEDAPGLVEVTMNELEGSNTLKVRVHSENAPALGDVVTVGVGPQI